MWEGNDVRNARQRSLVVALLMMKAAISRAKDCLESTKHGGQLPPGRTASLVKVTKPNYISHDRNDYWDSENKALF